MVNTQDKVREIIAQYKAEFARVDLEERYKWIAVKHFQDNWNIDSRDFADMLARSFAKHVNLLDAGVARPLYVVVTFAKREPDKARDSFRILYDESLPLEHRRRVFVEAVKEFVCNMQQEDPRWKNHFQDLHALSVYVTFRYPEKYYIYKYSVLEKVAPLIGLETGPERWKAYVQMCDAIRDVAVADEELISMSRARLDDECYRIQRTGCWPTTSRFSPTSSRKTRRKKSKMPLSLLSSTSSGSGSSGPDGTMGNPTTRKR